MSLTREDLAILSAPFAVSDHEFIRGFVYIRERAICDLIEMVDPAWSGAIRGQSEVIADGHIQVSVNYALTIKGVTREGIGSAIVISNNKGIVNEAIKSAVTDALKRAARLFGIGRYLLDTPDYVKDERSLAKWLETLGASPQSEPMPRNRHAGQATGKNWDLDGVIRLSIPFCGNEYQAANRVKKMATPSEHVEGFSDSWDNWTCATFVMLRTLDKDKSIRVKPEELPGLLNMRMAEWIDRGHTLLDAFNRIVELKASPLDVGAPDDDEEMPY